MSDPEDFCATDWIHHPDHPGYTESSIDDKKSSQVYGALYFYYDDPDSMKRFELCNQAEAFKDAIRSFDDELRRRWKYGEEAAQMMTVEQVRGLLFATLNRYDLYLS